MLPISTLAFMLAILSPEIASTPQVDKTSSLSASNAPYISAMVDSSISALAKNIFDMPFPQDPRWISVSGAGGYIGQYYSRDTFIALRGGVYASPLLRDDFEHAVDWFAQHQSPDGSIPLWFRYLNGDLHAYQYCPYDRDSSQGGVRQYDNVEDFIDAAALLYAWNANTQWLRTRYPQLRLAWEWLRNQSDGTGLIHTTISQYCGSDWADQVLRRGYATYVEEGWYHSTLSMKYAAAALGDYDAEQVYDSYLSRIRHEFNAMFWRVDRPKSYAGAPFGHYAAWIDAGRVYDYFEVDSNARAVSSGLASPSQALTIMRFISDHDEELSNPLGAYRVLYGHYDYSDSSVPIGTYQNGGYWFITSLYVAMAYRHLGDAPHLAAMARKLAYAVSSASLGEWYDSGGHLFGAPEYSWSEAMPLYLSFGAIAGLAPNGSLIARPCLDRSLGALHVQMNYRGSNVDLAIQPSCRVPDDLLDSILNE